ncbi:hypothetical protein B7P34_21680 [Streptosporangium nondiastaticum]|uniref:Uncharacterized protein n=2 Tax=Actinomycetes TaxID=1760 RepID=A0A9X7JN79_9ACTN|nr:MULTISPECIES: hypothetical protein [Actinomycetes]PSJ26668.1 hypothetical protein B7P34_21680 [Streptosporangium nondiastaticum]WKU46367.1 hypothetical protein Q3V23_21185 [Streptomyces sp. VNUA116]
MIDLGYSLSRRFPDPPQTDYRTADVRALRHDLFCGDVYIADVKADRELSTAWGWVPVLDFAWALCDVMEQIDRDPRGNRSAATQFAELDFTESTDCMLFERRFGWVEVSADWMPADEPALTFDHRALRREARDFLHDLIADLCDMHEGLADNPVIWDLQARFPRV